MSPFTIAVILLLTVLFALLSLTPVITGSKDGDSFDRSSNPKTKGAQ